MESSVGVESETQFAFAGLHQLCAPLLDRTGTLPDPQQAALGVAFGLHGGAAPDRFLVGLVILNTLAEVAEEAPLLCLVDDAQWLDEASAQVLAFVARRLGAERLALVFGLRDSEEGDRLPVAGLPELRLERLGESDARVLLSAEVRTPLDEAVRKCSSSSRYVHRDVWASRMANDAISPTLHSGHEEDAPAVDIETLRRNDALDSVTLPGRLACERERNAVVGDVVSVSAPAHPTGPLPRYVYPV